MFRSLSIKNYRCFEALEMDSLERVNLITGKNNSGKTALLESIFLQLGPGNPGLSLLVNAFRGIESYKKDPEDIWGWLFPEKDIRAVVDLAHEDMEGRRRTLTLRLQQPQKGPVSPRNGLAAAASGTTSKFLPAQEMVMEYKASRKGPLSKSRAYLSESGEVQQERGSVPSMPPGVFLHTHARPLKEDAERFSDLARVGAHEQIVESLHCIEPRLKGLEVLVTGGTPMVNADIGLPQKIPVPLMGEGTGRLMSMLLAIHWARGGTVLIDEIENGLHHAALLGAWKALLHAVRAADAQVFATTHSWECIRAAHRAFSESGTYDFKHIRLDRTPEGIRAVPYTQETLESAIALNLEVR